MRKCTALMARLRSRLAQDRLTGSEFTQAMAEILAATTDGLSDTGALMVSRELRDLEQAWRDSCNRSAG